VYFWNTKQLALDLCEGKVTERQQMWYLLAFTVLASVCIQVALWLPGERVGFSTYVGGLAAIGMTILGLRDCYQVNSRGDGRDFVIRFVCVSLPVTCRLVAVFLPLVIVFVLFIHEPPYTDPWFSLGIIYAQLAYYGRIRVWLIKISRAEISASSFAPFV